jgi:hypothetical protein
MDARHPETRSQMPAACHHIVTAVQNAGQTNVFAWEGNQAAADAVGRVYRQNNFLSAVPTCNATPP